MTETASTITAATTVRCRRDPRNCSCSCPDRKTECARDGVALDDIELWFADEARIGQKNKITRRWARRGTRPCAPHDQRTASTCIFGAICPLNGKGAALVLPRCDTGAMTLHLAEIATEIAPGKHAVLLLDQARWHMARDLVVPTNITLMPLSPKCPELNPVENVSAAAVARDRALPGDCSARGSHPKRPP
jgi:hypothetical protein